MEEPDHPVANYQAAWTCDSMGKEGDAVPFYERAIAKGLSGEDLRGSFLGLGSTLRCLGKYTESLEVFERGVLHFPTDRALKIFKALTLYNLGQYAESFETLLLQLIETTSDPDLQRYAKALRFYSDKLDQTWT